MTRARPRSRTRNGQRKLLLPPFAEVGRSCMPKLLLLRSAQSSRRRVVLHPIRSIHGGEQQHHGLPQLPGPPLHHPHRRHGDLAGLQAGRGLRPPGAVARRHPRRAPPPRLAGGLRRRVLEPEGPPRLLPLRHGGAHHAAPGAARVRLRRRARVRRVPGARPRVRGLPAGGVLGVAARVRHRRPPAVGGDQVLRCGVGHVQEARHGPILHRARAVLHVAPLAHPVGLLQAADGVRVRVREPDGVDEPGEPGGGPGLRGMEQRPRPALLRLRLLQGRRAGGAARAVAQGQRRPPRRHRRAHLRLRHRMQRLPERADRGPLPPLQVGQHLSKKPNNTCCQPAISHCKLRRSYCHVLLTTQASCVVDFCRVPVMCVI